MRGARERYGSREVKVKSHRLNLGALEIFHQGVLAWCRTPMLLFEAYDISGTLDGMKVSPEVNRATTMEGGGYDFCVRSPREQKTTKK